MRTYRSLLAFSILALAVVSMPLAAQRRSASSARPSASISRPSAPRVAAPSPAPSRRAAASAIPIIRTPVVPKSTPTATPYAPSATRQSAAAPVSAAASAPKLTAADQALARKAQIQGTSYANRSAAVSDFKTKTASKYTTSFSAEPRVRPDYIPSQTQVGGRSYSVRYDVVHHGYGYYAGSSWYSYDPYSDAVMLAALMSRNNYSYPVQQAAVVVPVAASPAVAVEPAAPQQVVVDKRWGFGTYLLVFGLIALVAWLFLRPRRSSYNY